MPVRRPLALALVLLAVFSARAAAQQPASDAPTGTIVGTAVAGDTGAPLPAVSVAIRRMSDSTLVAGAITDNAGRFAHTGLPLGEYRVELTSVGYVAAARNGVRVTTDTSHHDLGAVPLTLAVIELQGVTAEGRRATVTFETDRSVYHVREMPVVQGAMATDALRVIPELEVDVDDNIRARGGEPAIHLDGRPLPMQGEARTAFLRSLRADRIERIEYIPNPSARFEADGRSGIINIVLRRDTGLGFSGSLSANAGTRGTQNLSSRLNYQYGPVTFFGGGLLGLNQSDITTLDFRQNLAADPVTFLQQATDRETSRINGSADLTTEWKVSERSTAWVIGRANRSASDDGSFSEFIHLDADRIATERYDRANNVDSGTHGYSGALGFRRVIQTQRDEFSVEVRYNANGSGSDTENLRHPRSLDGNPLPVQPDLTRVGVDSDDGTWAVQADLSKPAGSVTRIDVGYRANLRLNKNLQDLTLLTFGPGTTADFRDHGFRFSEDSHAAYLTLNHRLGRLGIQAGLRAERVDGLISASSIPEDVALRHDGFFPSANLAWDFGGGRQARLSYSRRIQRPVGSMLNPMNTTPTDPFNRFVGNPRLEPADVHNVSLDGSWSGSLGSLSVSQFLFHGSNLWDQIRTVDSDGVMTAMSRNVATARQYGIGLNGSLRQMGPFSGFVAWNAFYVDYDAGNLAGMRSVSSVSWMLNANLMATVTPTLRMQATGFHSPGQVSPQGRFAGMTQTNVALTRRILEERGVLTLSIVDPFNLSTTTFTSRQETHESSSRSTNRVRRATLSFSYNFGRAPQSNRRVIQDEVGAGGGGGFPTGGGQ